MAGIWRHKNLPGVRSVGIGSQLPVSFNGNTDWIRFVGRAYGRQNNPERAHAAPVNANAPAVAVLLASAALLARFIPARRAACVNPLDALRAE